MGKNKQKSHEQPLLDKKKKDSEQQAKENTITQVERQSENEEKQHYIGHFDKAPKFMKENVFITHGYRIGFNTPLKILRSLFMVHNESVNIWSHCLPAMIVLILLITGFLMVNVDGVRNSIGQYQKNFKEGLDHYSQTLQNFTLLAQYNSLSIKTNAEIQEIKQSALQSYQAFTTKFKKISAEYKQIVDDYQSKVEGEVDRIKTNLKQTLKKNMVLFEKAKIQFEKHLAPRLLQEFHKKFDDTWVGDLEKLAEKVKNQIDSDQFQYVELHEQKPNPNQISRWPIVVFLITAAICLLSSTVFHLFYPMSSRIYTLTNRFDYAGINLLISGSAFPPLYYGMYCHLAVATIYLSLSLTVATVCFVVCLFEWIHRPGHQKYKAFMFAGFGISNLIPLSHMIINQLVYDNYGDPFIFTPSFPYYLLLGASYLGGLYIYTVRCPQRQYPGKFNLCGSSHQIWHGMVVLGIIFTYLGALQNFEMRKVSVCPA